MNKELEREEANVIPSVFGRSSERTFLPLNTMISVTRIIPIVTEGGEIDIPREAFARLASVSERFNVVLEVHEHALPSAYHGRDYVDVPHLLLHLVADSDEELVKVIDAIDPEIEELVNTQTNMELAVPAGR